MLSRSCLGAVLPWWVSWAWPMAQCCTLSMQHSMVHMPWLKLSVLWITHSPGTGFCQAGSLQPVLWGSKTRQVRWSQKGIRSGIWKWRPACVLQHCSFSAQVLHDLLASKYLMSPYKNMNWLLKIAYNWTLKSICFLSDNTFPVIMLKYTYWQ